MSAPQGYDITQIPGMTPEMIGLFNNLMQSMGGGPGGGLDYLNKLSSGDEDIFKQIEAPAYQALEQNMAKTANRYSGVGGQDSSSFANAQAGQVGQMATDLASQRNQLQTGATDKLMQYSQSLLSQKPQQYGMQEQGGMDWQSMIKVFGPIIMAMVTKNPALLASIDPESVGRMTRGPQGPMIG